ncbi:MAG: type II toxin-antitoxin system RelE/ParE family toxin [Helicobacter sp.]|nr:type II toxin-antitoxin system RelE/ParE family toxin [Helicobacter sp.]
MQIILASAAKKKLKKLDAIMQKRIASFFDELKTLDNPRTRGRALVGNLVGFWRYRVGDYRIICEIVDSELVIYAIDITHRKDAY